MKILTITAAIFLSLTVNAQQLKEHKGIHTPNVCVENTNVCAHLMFPKAPNSSDESQFIVHFMTQETIKNVNVMLWMPDMGHGSAPVTLNALDPVHYKISQAFFIMPGLWEVQVSFEINNELQQIKIPVNIQE